MSMAKNMERPITFSIKRAGVVEVPDRGGACEKTVDLENTLKEESVGVTQFVCGGGGTGGVC